MDLRRYNSDLLYSDLSQTVSWTEEDVQNAQSVTVVGRLCARRRSFLFSVCISTSPVFQNAFLTVAIYSIVGAFIDAAHT